MKLITILALLLIPAAYHAVNFGPIRYRHLSNSQPQIAIDCSEIEVYHFSKQSRKTLSDRRM
jgi:hypothetical protein